MQITIDVDPKANGQTIYSPDLDLYLQIYLLPQSQVDTQLQQAQQKLSEAQGEVDALTTQTSARSTLLAAKALPAQPIDSASSTQTSLLTP